ncbi:RNA 2',3'-cyclic phosphodiesterase [Euzebya rosea]|uniref:RNA 2',3'-cyclic phosphodiesterase n=1 Tax=Euzebya rosea TaxID=2052804 RepID=UPI000D3E4754|nr:RNA 2',3'-cyclic phosphodiesterase [Euzebya rosea]
MRSFVALPVPTAVATMIQPAVGVLRDRWPGLRWTDPLGWHLTLAFLGEVDDATATAVCDAVRSAVADVPSVAVRLPGSADTAPGSRGIVWLPVTSPPLPALAEGVRDACDAAGAPPDRDRAFRGHLTLCRVPRRSTDDPAALARTVAAAYDGPPLSWTADRVEVLRSDRTATGARYVELASIPLT